MQLLSVIVPVYNVEKFINDCIDSILGQSYKNIELILVDDGSTDSSGEICDKYCSVDKRVKVIHQNNKGCSAARNAGIANAKGNLIAFMDADDLIDQDMYEVLIKNLDMTNSDVSACSYVKEYNLDRGKIIGLHKIIPDPIVFIGKSAIYESVTRNEKSVEGYLWNKVWKREVIGNHLFREDIVMCEDSIFSWEVLKSVNRVCYCDLPMYHYRILTTSATRNSSLEKMSGALVSYELMLDDASLLPKDVVKNLAIQYLGWNYTIFQHMIREKERTPSLYEKVKSNCVCYQEYSCYLGLADRIGINAIAKHNYTCAKLSVQAVGIMQLIKKKICRIVKKQV